MKRVFYGGMNMNHVVGIIAMLFGFFAMTIKNYSASFVCFGFAFVLWVVVAIHELIERKKGR